MAHVKQGMALPTGDWQRHHNQGESRAFWKRHRLAEKRMADEPISSGPAPSQSRKKRFGLRLHYNGFFGRDEWTTWYASERARDDAMACNGGIVGRGSIIRPTKVEKIER